MRAARGSVEEAEAEKEVSEEPGPDGRGGGSEEEVGEGGQIRETRSSGILLAGYTAVIEEVVILTLPSKNLPQHLQITFLTTLHQQKTSLLITLVPSSPLTCRPLLEVVNG